MSEDELVLVYPRDAFDDVTHEKVIENLTMASGGQFMARSRAETDLDFVQVIPYILIFNRGYQLFKRAAKIGEPRLSGRTTLGVGGHINYSDATDPETGEYDSNFRRAYYRGARRELREELGASVGNYAEWENQDWHECVALIRLQDTPVNSVHVGLVHKLQIPDNMSIECDESISLYSMYQYSLDRSSGEVKSLNLESWSQYLVETGVVPSALVK